MIEKSSNLYSTEEGYYTRRTPRQLEELKRSLYGNKPENTKPAPLTDAQIAEQVVADAERNGHELVLNPLHPANREDYVEPESALDRIARGAEAIGREMRSYGAGGVEKMDPENPWD
jgi:hypothetical protein